MRHTQQQFRDGRFLASAGRPGLTDSSATIDACRISFECGYREPLTCLQLRWRPGGLSRRRHQFTRKTSIAPPGRITSNFQRSLQSCPTLSVRPPTRPSVGRGRVATPIGEATEPAMENKLREFIAGDESNGISEIVADVGAAVHRCACCRASAVRVFPGGPFARSTTVRAPPKLPRPGKPSLLGVYPPFTPRVVPPLRSIEHPLLDTRSVARRWPDSCSYHTRSR